MIDRPPELLPPPFPGLVARRLGLEDAEALRALRRHVLANLEDPDHYRIEGESGDLVAAHLGDRGLVIGVFAPGSNHERETVLVAYGALGLPGPNDANRGADLPLPLSEWPQVAHVSSVMVAPAYRGRGLHRWLLARRLEAGAEQGRRHFLTTVSPRNHPSWGNLVAGGLYIKRLVVVGGGLVRCLVHRDLEVTARFDPTTAVRCQLSDMDRQRELLADGQWVWDKGRASNGQPCMMFGHPILS